MTEMAQFREQRKAANALHDSIKSLFGQGKSVKIASLVQEMTLTFAVSEKYIQRRIALYKESDPRIIEEDGELWLRLDIIKE